MIVKAGAIRRPLCCIEKESAVIKPAALTLTAAWAFGA